MKHQMKRVVAVEVPDNVFLLRVHLSAPPPKLKHPRRQRLASCNSALSFFLVSVPGTRYPELKTSLPCSPPVISVIIKQLVTLADIANGIENQLRSES